MEKSYRLDEVQDAITRVIAAQYTHAVGQEIPQYGPNDSVTDKLEFDSLDTVELIMALEEEFEIDISEQLLPEDYTPTHLLDIIKPLLGGRLILSLGEFLDKNIEARKEAKQEILDGKRPIKDRHPLNFGNMDFKPENVQALPVVTADGSVPKLKADYAPLSTPWEHFGLTPVAFTDDAFTKGWFYFTERKAITDHIISTQESSVMMKAVVLVGELAVKVEAFRLNAGLAPETLTWFSGKVRTGLLTGGETKEYWIVAEYLNGHRAGYIMWEIDPAAKILAFLSEGHLVVAPEIYEHMSELLAKASRFRQPATVGLNWSQP